MPVSPFQRAVEEGLVGHEPPTQPQGKKKRKAKQRKRKLYQKIREDLQVSGDLPVTTEGALRPEAVDPRIQTGIALPAVVREALRECWATPDAAKPAIIAALLEPFFADDIVLDADGNQVHVKPSRKMIMELAKTLMLLDQRQWERDHPVQAGQAKGGGINTIAVSVESNMLAVKVIREALERDDGGGETALPPPTKPSPPGFSRFDGEVEVGAALTSDQ